MTFDAPASERTALYRLYDTDDRLLYVGITNDPKKRWTHHASMKPWWPDVARHAVEWYDSRPEAEVAEFAAIRSEAPIHNGQHARSPIEVHASAAEVRRDARYLRIAATLRSAIQDGAYPAGTKLPPTRDLKEMFNTTSATIGKAVED